MFRLLNAKSKGAGKGRNYTSFNIENLKFF